MPDTETIQRCLNDCIKGKGRAERALTLLLQTRDIVKQCSKPESIKQKLICSLNKQIRDKQEEIEDNSINIWLFSTQLERETVGV